MRKKNKSRKLYDKNRYEKGLKKCAQVEYYQRSIEERRQFGREYYQQARLVPEKRFKICKRSATRSGKEFLLNFKEFLTFWQKPCYYCGESIDSVGLDRIDSTRGYTLTNLVPCCWPCNEMKKNKSRDVFISRCEKISQYQLAGRRI